MKTLKQIRENYDDLVNKEEANTELASLVRMGLLESNKLPMLKRSLEKDPSEMTIAEKKTLLDFANTLLETTLIKEATMADHLSKMDPSFSKQFTEKDLPTVIILKRKAVRVFPDKQKIALYYSQALDKYISIPFGPQTKSVGDISMQLSEESDPNKVHPLAKLDTSDLPEPYQILVRKTVKAHQTAGGKVYKGTKTKATKLDVLKHLNTREATKLPGGTVRSIGRDIATLGNQPGRLIGKIAGTLTLKGARIAKSGVQAAAKGIKSLVSEEHDAQPQIDEGALDYIPGYTASKQDMLRRAKQPLSQNLKDFAKSVPETVLSGLGPMKGASAAVSAAKAGTKMITGMSKAGKAAGAANRVSKGGRITDPARLAKRKAIEKMLRNKRAGKGKDGILSRLGSAIGGGSASGGSGSSSTDAKEAGSRAVTPKSSYDFSAGGRFAGQLGGSQRVTYDPNDLRNQRIAFGQNIYGKPMAEDVSNFEKIKFVAENKIDGAVIPYGDNSVTINNRVANKIMNIYESLNRTNKKKVEKMLNEDASSFKKVINFAIRQ